MRLSDYTRGNRLFVPLREIFVPAFRGVQATQRAVDQYLRAADSLFGPENHQLEVVDWALQQVVGWMIPTDLLMGHAVGGAGQPPTQASISLVNEVKRFNQAKA